MMQAVVGPPTGTVWEGKWIAHPPQVHFIHQRLGMCALLRGNTIISLMRNLSFIFEKRSHVVGGVILEFGILLRLSGTRFWFLMACLSRCLTDFGFKWLV